MKIYKISLYDRLVIFLLYWISFQDILLAFLYNVTGSKIGISLLFYLKDFLLIGLFLIAFFRNRLKKSFSMYIYIYIMYLLVMGVIGYANTSDLTSVLGSFRGWLLAPLLVAIGYNVSEKRIVAKKVISFYSNFLLIIAIIGIIEYFVDIYVTTTVPIWTNLIGIGNFITDIKGMGGTVLYGLPGNFYGSYGNGYFSTKTLVSIYGNHLTYAYIMVIPCLYYFYKIIYSKKKPFIKFFIIYLSLLLSFTRIIILLITVSLLIIALFKSSWIRSLVLLSIPIWILIFILNVNSLNSYLFDGSTQGHILALYNGFSNLNLLASGIGTFGIWSNIGTESTYLSCLGQLGLIGLVAYLGFYIYCLEGLRNSLKKSNSKINEIFILKIATFNSGIILFITGFISEQLIAYTSIAPFYIILGYLLKCNKNVI